MFQDATAYAGTGLLVLPDPGSGTDISATGGGALRIAGRAQRRRSPPELLLRWNTPRSAPVALRSRGAPSGERRRLPRRWSQGANLAVASRRRDSRPGNSVGIGRRCGVGLPVFNGHVAMVEISLPSGYQIKCDSLGPSFGT